MSTVYSLTNSVPERVSASPSAEGEGVAVKPPEKRSARNQKPHDFSVHVAECMKLAFEHH